MGPQKTPQKLNKRKKSGETPPSVKKEAKKLREMKSTNDMDETIAEMREELEDVIAQRGADGVTTESTNEKLDKIAESIEFLTQSVNEVKEALKIAQKEIQEVQAMKQDIEALKLQNQLLSEKLTAQEDYSRRNNAIVTGLEEKKGEDCRAVCTNFLKEFFNMENVAIVRTHRLGPASQAKRKMIIRFKNHEDKEKMMRGKKFLREKKANIYLEDDYAPETMRKRGSLLPVVKELRKVDPRAHLRGDKIFSNGRLYSHRHLHDLPIDPHIACTESKENVTAFSGTYSKLSNLYQHQFQLDERQWHSVEQYYQHQKAERAGDTENARKILTTSDPVEAMICGKSVNPGPSWEKEGPEAMKRAQLVKFSYPPLRLALMNTKPIIAEATHNEFWGIGMTRSNKDWCNPKLWRGKNMDK